MYIIRVSSNFLKSFEIIHSNVKENIKNVNEKKLKNVINYFKIKILEML